MGGHGGLGALQIDYNKHRNYGTGQGRRRDRQIQNSEIRWTVGGGGGVVGGSRWNNDTGRLPMLPSLSFAALVLEILVTGFFFWVGLTGDAVP